MNTFAFKKHGGLTALSATMTDFSYKKHSHGEYAIGVTTHGIQKYTLDGSMQLSHKNGVMFFNPEQVHDGCAFDEQGLTYSMLYIDPSLLLEATGARENLYFPRPIVYNQRLQRSVLNLAHAVLHQADEAVNDDLLMTLLAELDGSKYERNDVQKQDSLVTKIKHELLLDATTLRIEDISAKFSMSKYQFIRFFNKQTNMTPYQYFLNSKVEATKRFIEEEKDIYSAISQFDFVDITHLNRQFKRIYGITANDYMRQIKQDHG